MVISAHQFDRHTLEQVIIPRFVTSHGAPSAMIDQLTRWQMPVCPKITGLAPLHADYVIDRIIRQAQKVGAPTAASAGSCVVDVGVVFTSAPQELLDVIAKKYPKLLGSARGRHDTTMSRAIQAWYTTATRSTNGAVPRFDPQWHILMPDPEWGEEAMVAGMAGSRLTKRLQSGLVHVIVVADAGQLSHIKVGAIADYIAMIALSRAGSQAACSELPSILDLLSPACVDRAGPESITAADGAFLKALYHANLERNLNIEQGEIRDLMLTELEGH